MTAERSRHNPVHKFSVEFNKPQTHRDRKKHKSKKDEYKALTHENAVPYKRDRRIIIDGLGDEWYD